MNKLLQRVSPWPKRALKSPATTRRGIRADFQNRLQENAERYDLKFSEGGALVVVFTILGFVLGDFILIKNFNKMAKAYNDYNGLADPDADKKIYFFADED